MKIKEIQLNNNVVIHLFGHSNVQNQFYFSRNIVQKLIEALKKKKNWFAGDYVYNKIKIKFYFMWMLLISNDLFYYYIYFFKFNKKMFIC